MNEEPKQSKKSTRKAVPGKGNVGLYVYESEREKYYYVRKQQAGREPLHQKLDTTNLNIAREEARRLIREWEGKPAEQFKKQVKLVGEHWIKFEQIKADKSEATVHSVKNSGKHLMRFFADHRPDELTSDLWEDYIIFKRKEDVAKKHLKKLGRPIDDEAVRFFMESEAFTVYMEDEEPTSKRKFENDWKWFAGFVKYLHNSGFILRKPELRNPDPNEQIGKVLTDEQVSALIKSSMNTGRYHNIGNPRMRAKIILAATTGMRNSECLFLTDGSVVDSKTGEKFSWVDFDRKVIHLRAEDTKIRSGRDVPMPDQALVELLALYGLTGGPYILAPNPKKRPNRAADKTAWTHTRKRAGVSCRFHDLRHTYLTKAFRRALEGMRTAQASGSIGGQVGFSVDCFAICEAAGLSLEEAQKTYLKLSVDDLRPVASLVTVTLPKLEEAPEVRA